MHAHLYPAYSRSTLLSSRMRFFRRNKGISPEISRYPRRAHTPSMFNPISHSLEPIGTVGLRRWILD